MMMDRSEDMLEKVEPKLETAVQSWYRCASFFMSEEGEAWLRHTICNRMLPRYVAPK